MLELGSVHLVPVREEHAEYIYSLRVDETLNKFLSKPPASAVVQAEWIQKYVEREKVGSEYYFVIAVKGGAMCGTVRLYDFRPESFCWGSWILDRNKTRFAAVESALLVYRIGFEKLNFVASHFEVRKANSKVITFHLRFGARVTSEGEDNIYMQLTRKAFEEKEPDLLKLISGGSSKCP
jgi:hypothetical protein